MDIDIETRLIDLETRLAHHERMAEDMSAIVADQQRAIDMLEHKVRLLTDRLRDAAAGWERSPQDDRPPPHY